MKNKRHNKIIEIIESDAIETQDDLISRLREQGFNVTQATISRDIKELGIVKISTMVLRGICILLCPGGGCHSRPHIPALYYGIRCRSYCPCCLRRGKPPRMRRRQSRPVRYRIRGCLSPRRLSEIPQARSADLRVYFREVPLPALCAAEVQSPSALLRADS